MKIKFQKIDMGDAQVILFTGASFANMPDKKGSVRGHVVVLFDTKKKLVNVLSS